LVVLGLYTGVGVGEGRVGGCIQKPSVENAAVNSTLVNTVATKIARQLVLCINKKLNEMDCRRIAAQYVHFIVDQAIRPPVQARNLLS
jgi:hypothetical protein